MSIEGNLSLKSVIVNMQKKKKKGMLCNGGIILKLITNVDFVLLLVSGHDTE